MKKGRSAALGVAGLCQREVGGVTPRSFARCMAASEELVLRLKIHRKLDVHRGCVNTVSFNSDGDVLLSGSDDRRVILWDWEAGIVKLSFHSCHSNNVFQARFMPYTNDRIIVTCAADGEVRHAEILEGGQVSTTLLGRHRARVHKLAIEPGSPHIFYSCGEDGLVQRFDLRSRTAMKLFICKAYKRKPLMSIVNLNAITIDPRNPNLFAVAGSDEYARLYDIRKNKWDGSSDFDHPIDSFCPPHLIGEEDVGITGLAFSDQSELLVSYNDEFIYLFTRDQGLGSNPVQSSLRSSLNPNSGVLSSSGADSNPRPEPQVYKGHRNFETVKGVSFFGPSSEYVTSGSDCGRIFIWKKDDGDLLRVMDGDQHVVNCIESHPYATVIASCGIENDVKIWTPNATQRAPHANLDEILKYDRIDYFSIDDLASAIDADVIDDDNTDDDFDCDDGDGNDDDDDNDDDNDDDDGDDDGNDDDVDDGGGGGGGDDDHDDVCYDVTVDEMVYLVSTDEDT